MPHADFGVMRRYDGQTLDMLAGRGLAAALAEHFGQTTNTPMPGAAPARTLESGRPIQVLDATTSPPYKAGDPGARAVADLGGARTMLHVPLSKDNAAVGLFTLYRQDVRAFTDKQIALLENFAAQAVIAMENARLWCRRQNRCPPTRSI
jgi:GAF domain-containing protein